MRFGNNLMQKLVYDHLKVFFCVKTSQIIQTSQSRLHIEVDQKIFSRPTIFQYFYINNQCLSMYRTL